ncbi:MAG TPA: F0F1 ATP synthase subunit gamma, partial [Bacteroidia bacterium]
ISEEIMKEFSEGHIESEDNISIHTKAGGTVSRLLIAAGDNVTAGQLLAELDNRHIILEIAEVQKALNAAYAGAKDESSSQNQIENQEKKLEQLQEQLDGKRLKSPISGTVDGLFVKAGDTVAADTAAIRVVNFKRTYDVVELVYNQFKNVATQVLTQEQYLPVAKPVQQKSAKKVSLDYIYEPTQDDIVKELIPKALKTQLYKALLDSNASEHGARMTAMHKATDNAQELLKDLRLTYNKARQATITKEILEIVGGAEALKN